MRKLVLVILCLFLFFVNNRNVFGQQDPQYSQYMFNTLIINPAYAGYKETYNLSAIYRSQWAGVEGAPKTQTLVVDGSFAKDRVGLALGIVNDRAGLRGKFTTYLNYSYKLPAGEKGQLALGLAVGFSQYSYDGRRATYEEAQTVNLDSRFNYVDPDARFGVYYSNDRFYAGLSATNLVSNLLSTDNAARRAVATQAKHYFITAGYLFDINDFLKCKPSFLLKEDTKGPTGMDWNVNFLIAERVWFGGSYRSNPNLWKKTNFAGNKGRGFVGIVQYVGANWNVGYSYDYSGTAVRSFNSTHELSIGVALNKKKDIGILSPRYF